VLLLVRKFSNRVFWGSRKYVLQGILLGLAIASISGYFFRERLPHDPLTYILTATTWGFLGGFTEEPPYRGTLMKGIQEKLNWPVAWLLQALLFGVSHIWSFEAVIAAWIFGLLLGIIIRYLGIGSGIAIHFSTNIITHNLL
jgi:membrane protease YdiL (CAAX protease family)